MDLKRLNELAPKQRKRKRIGCGPGSGKGKTSGRGHKGQKSRSGGARPLFEGGQMPLFRRVPKRGFSNYPHKKFYTHVNVESLNIFDADTVVTVELLMEKRLIRRRLPVKVLGNGELRKPLTVNAAAFTKTATRKIEEAGGKAEVTV